MQPFLKWVGGKAQCWPMLSDHVPDLIDGYFEPFLGGGSVLINILSSVEAGTLHLQGPVVVNDANLSLINAYRVVQTDPVALCAMLTCMLQDTSALAYYEARALFNQVKESQGVQTAALFIFLNRVGFRGLYRESSTGVFNVPFGHYESPVINVSNIVSLSHLFQKYNVTFECVDFKAFFSKWAPSITAASFVYMDPPYVPIKSRGFTEYTSTRFGAIESNDAVGLVRDLRYKCRVVYCNHDLPVIRAAFQDWPVVRTWSARRFIHCKNPGSSEKELLITNHANTSVTTMSTDIPLVPVANDPL